jgi:hypothetical protein
MPKSKDIIRITENVLTCEECGKDIEPGSLVNEYVEITEEGKQEDPMFYCMECLPSLVGMGVEWTRDDN